MKIYLSSRMSRIDEMRKIAFTLNQMGHTVVGRWIYGQHAEDSRTPFAERAAFAKEDIEDIHKSDALILFTENGKTPSKGGRFVEFGIGLALNLRVICVGPRENVFTCLDQVEYFPTSKAMLDGMANEMRVDLNEQALKEISVLEAGFSPAIQARELATPITHYREEVG